MAKNNKICSTLYTPKVLETFKKPHNYGTMKNPDGVGVVGNPTCGDVMKLYIKVGKGEVIKDIRFETFGCVAAIATSSIITDMVKGKTIKQAMKITKDGVVEELGGLPKIKYHCSVLAVDALHKAIENYNGKIKSKK
jgi:nitrogen fixation NifU-like protein